MNTVVSTNQNNVPLIIGALETFSCENELTLNGAPWDMTGGTVTLTLTDPRGNKTVLNVTPPENLTVSWIVTGPKGSWDRRWNFTSASGVNQPAFSIMFKVTN